MTIEQVKQICSKFLPIQKDGKTKCAYYIGDGLCKLPTEFLCKVTSELRKAREEGETISFSKIATFLKCPRLYMLEYIEKVPKPFSKAMWLGQQLHLAIAKRATGQEFVLEEKIPSEITESDLALLKSALVVIQELPKEDGEPEKEFTLKLKNGKTLVGIADFVKPGLVREYKFAESIDNYHLSSIYLQASIYAHAFDAKEVEVVVITKPRIKLRKGESIQDFSSRLLGEMRIQRKTYLRRELASDIESKVMTVMKMIEVCEETGWYPHSVTSCRSCDLSDVCRSMLSPEEASKGDETSTTSLEATTDGE